MVKLDQEAKGAPALPVRKRADTAREVASELLELVSYGHEVRAREGADSAVLFGTLFNARLTAEQQLTALGSLDAPPLIRHVRKEHEEACQAAVAHWRALREKLEPLCEGAAEFERLAPWV